MPKDKKQHNADEPQTIPPSESTAGHEQAVDDAAVAGVRVDEKEYTALCEKAAQLDELRDNLVRQVADYENTKKRLIKEKEDFVQYANKKIILEVLPIVDNLERAGQSARANHSVEALIDGVSLIEKQLQDVLKDHGLERITAVGEHFDPHKHEAIGAIESADYDDEVVVEEIAPGYMYKDTLLRPAMVRINKKPHPAEQAE